MSLVVPPMPADVGTSEAVRAIFFKFESQAQRLRAILRLLLVAVMVLVVVSSTPRSSWPAQLSLVIGYAVLAVLAAWVRLQQHPRTARLRALEPMMPIDIAAICVLQLLSPGSYLMLGLLAFLPFFIATQAGRRAAIMSVAAIVGAAIAVLADPLFRRQMSAPEIAALLVMLALLCLCSYTVSRVQQRRLASIAELTASRAMLLNDVMTAEERERRRVAEALHDGPLQTLLAARQDLRDAIRPNPDLSGVARASELLTDVARELRQTTRELHPSVLEEGGLEHAVRGLLDALAERTGVVVDCSIDYPHPHDEDAMVYGVSRELLTNVARHANADRVWLTLRDDGDTVTLEVRDDGVGIDPSVLSRRVAEGHIGLASQRSRVESLRGTWEFRPVERGTWVRVRLPLRDHQEVR